jgi:hypothetical protein
MMYAKIRGKWYQNLKHIDWNEHKYCGHDKEKEKRWDYIY